MAFLIYHKREPNQFHRPDKETRYTCYVPVKNDRVALHNVDPLERRCLPRHGKWHFKTPPRLKLPTD